MPHKHGLLKKFKIGFMKKYIFSGILVAALMGCNDGGNNTSGDEKTNAAANDSTTAPDGAANSSAISTNPNATKTDTTTNE